MITKGLEDGQCACLPDMLRMVHTLSGNVGDLAIHKLAEVIKNDTIVLEKVISAANTVGYNPTGAEITTIAQAIQVIGFSRVRSLTMSLILLENSNAWQNSDERRKASMASLTSGLMAEQLAGSTMGVNPEVAFLCGALRGFAHIVLATYMLEDYRQAETLAEELPSDTAYQELFGLTPLELGHHLMESNNLSPVLLKTLKQYNPHDHKESLVTPEDKLLGIADYAFHLSRLAIDESLSETDYRKSARLLRKRYEDTVKASPNDLDGMLEETTRHLRGLSTGTSISAFAQKAMNCLKSRADREDPPNRPKQRPPKVTTPEQKHEKLEVHRRTQVFHDGVARLKEISMENGDSRKKAMDELLKTVRHGLEADETWAFLQKPNKPGYHFSHGIGTHSLLLEGTASFQAKENNVFSLCLARKETVFIGNARDPKVRPYLPAWFTHNVDLNSFVLLCLQNKQGVQGLVFAGWKAARQTKIPADHIRLIHNMLALVGQQQ
ncbi:MAG: HDOD domain-containing protein [Puniceicoccaceae bacterium]